MEKTRPTHTFLCVTLPRNSHTWNASSVCGAKRVHVTFPHRDTACWKSPFHSNATTMDVAHCSEPRYPAMTNKSPLYNGLLTWIGTDCAFWKERVISNRLYISWWGKVAWDATNGSWKVLFAPQTGLAFHVWLFLGRVTHRNACAGWVFRTERKQA